MNIMYLGAQRNKKTFQVLLEQNQKEISSSHLGSTGRLCRKVETEICKSTSSNPI